MFYHLFTIIFINFVMIVHASPSGIGKNRLVGPGDTFNSVYPTYHESKSNLGEEFNKSGKDIINTINDVVGSKKDSGNIVIFCNDGLCKPVSESTNLTKLMSVINDKNEQSNEGSEVRIVQNEEANKKKIKVHDNVISVEATHVENPTELFLHRPGVYSHEIQKHPPQTSLQTFNLGSSSHSKYYRMNSAMEKNPFNSAFRKFHLQNVLRIRAPKIRVTQNETHFPKVYEDTKHLLPKNTTQEIFSHQVVPGMGCVYEKGIFCDGFPIKFVKTPRAMKLIAKIYRMLKFPKVIKEFSFYLLKHEPKDVYVEEELPFKPCSCPKKSRF